AFDVAEKILRLAGVRTWPGGEPFRVVVALHYGTVTCTNVGVAAERDATIIGDAVNTVFRLEAVAKEIEQDLVLSSDVAEHLPVHAARFKDFGERALKGKHHTTRIFALA